MKCPEIAVCLHRNDAGTKLERNRVADIFERAQDVRAAERWMPGKRHLECRRENAHMGRRTLGRQQERRFGQVELQCERLHRRVVESAAILEHAKGIALKRRFGKYVDDSIRIAVHRDSYPTTTSGCALRVSTSRASARKPAGDISATSASAASAWRRKFRAIERV